MHIRDKIQTILRYYSSHRGIGYSRAQQLGTMNEKCIVVTNSITDAELDIRNSKRYSNGKSQDNA